MTQYSLLIICRRVNPNRGTEILHLNGLGESGRGTSADEATCFGGVSFGISLAGCVLALGGEFRSFIIYST